MLHLADGLVNVAFQLLGVSAERMKHGECSARGIGGVMRPQGNNLIIRLRPLLSI